MDQSIEELRAQRDLIKKHLEWLDRKLAEVDSSSNSPAAEPVEVAKKATTDASNELASVDVTSAETPKAESSPPLLEPDPEQLVPPIQNDVRRATAGCIIFFVLSSALFLFLLFGLPYLLD